MIKKQIGSTLIVVLIMLVLVTLIGTLAIKQGILSLNIATNSQAQQLVLQNSDAATFNTENPLNLKIAQTPIGMFGYLEKANRNDKELVFCYKGSQADFFKLSDASLIYENDSGTVVNNLKGTKGYCKVDSSENFFTSARKTVLTQVHVRYTETKQNAIFADSLRGTDEEQFKVPPAKRVVVTTISLMPTLSSASASEVDACLSGKVVYTTNENNSLTKCLRDKHVPFTAHVTEYSTGQKVG